MKTCPNCGAKLKDGVDVCDKCGALSEDLQDLLAELASDNTPKEELEINVPDEDLKSNVNEDSVIDNLHKELGFESAASNNIGAASNQNDEPVAETEVPSVDTEPIKPAATLEIEDIEIPCDDIIDDEEESSPVKKVIGILILILIFAAAGVGGYKYYNYQANQKEETAEQKKAEAEEKKAEKEAEEKAKEEAEMKKAEEEAAKKAEEAAKKADEEQTAADSTQTTTNNSSTTTNKTASATGLGVGLTGVDSAAEPARLYNDSYPNGDVKLYWICDRTLSDDLIQAEANKWGASWIIQYVYAKHGYSMSGFNYAKYGFSATTTDKAAVEAQFNGAEKRNITKLLNY